MTAPANCIFDINHLKFIRRLAGEIGDDTVGVFQIKDLEDGVRGLAVLALHDGVLQAHLFGGHVVCKDRLAMQPQPGVLRAGDGNFNVGVDLHVLVHLFGVVGAEPELAVQLAGEHKGAALSAAVPADGGQVLHRVGGQKFYDFFHG